MVCLNVMIVYMFFMKNRLSWIKDKNSYYPVYCKKFYYYGDSHVMLSCALQRQLSNYEKAQANIRSFVPH